jgi:hypothetical protein
MEHTAEWNFARPDNNRLTDLLKMFGCADIIAPIDAESFGKRVGELLTRAAFGKGAGMLPHACSRRGAARPTERAQDRSRTSRRTSTCPNAVNTAANNAEKKSRPVMSRAAKWPKSGETPPMLGGGL